MKWILIMVLQATALSQSTAAVSIQFSSEKACQEALTRASRQFRSPPFNITVNGFCQLDHSDESK